MFLSERVRLAARRQGVGEGRAGGTKVLIVTAEWPGVSLWPGSESLGSGDARGEAMPSTPPPRRIALLTCAVIALALLGTLAGTTSAGIGQDRAGESSLDQDEGQVTITSPADGSTYAHANLIKIDLDFEETDTAVLTLRNVTNAGREPVTFYVTVEDTDGSGDATVYFNPFQGFDGPVTDCEADVRIEDCDDFFVPDDHPNNGFFTRPDGGSALLETDRPAAVRVDDGQSAWPRGPAPDYLTPAGVTYEVAASAGTEIDSDHRNFPEDSTEFRLDPITECRLDLYTAPASGPDALSADQLADDVTVESLLDRESVAPVDDGAYVGDDRYVVFDLQAPGIEGIFHEALRTADPTQKAAFLDRTPNQTAAVGTAVTEDDGKLSAFRLDVDPSSQSGFDLSTHATVESVIAGTDDRDHFDRYALVLRFDSDRIADSSSGVTNVTGAVMVADNLPPRISPRADDSGAMPFLNCRTNEVTWQLYDADNVSISAGFTSPPSIREVGENATFNGLRSEGAVDSYEWDFGDGTTATGRSVKHAFEEPGAYTVELTVSGPGGTDSTTETVVVVEDAEDPYPGLNVTVEEPEVGTEIGKDLRFEARGGGTLAQRYEWDFGDGTTATGRSVTHSYGEPGEYTVELTVVGPAGDNVTTRTVDVDSASEPTVSIEGSTANGAVVLEAESDGGAIDRYGWDVGDGTTYDAPNVTHTYEEPGEYTVELRVTGPGGTDSASTTVTVVGPDEPTEEGELSVAASAATDDEANSDDGSGPGFGVVVAITALLAVTVARRRS